MKQYVVITLTDGDEYGVPAELIANNYAEYYESRGDYYKESFDLCMDDRETLLDWFENNMDYDDYSEKLELISHGTKSIQDRIEEALEEDPDALDIKYLD